MRYFISRHKRIIFISASLVILLMTLWGTNRFLSEFKKEERAKMEILTSVYHQLIEADAEDSKLMNLSTDILIANHSIPIIIIQNDSTIFSYRNIKVNNPEKLFKKAKEFAKQNKPFYMDLNDGNYWNIYYGNSSLYKKLTYYPLVLILLFFVFSGIIYQYYRTGKISDENRLWSGLAKETAHQIGTPLSSLMGWVEILKSEDNLDLPVEEIEKDVQRLNVISQRFSKIGSTPDLETLNIGEISKRTIQYIKNRTSKLVDIQIDAPKELFGLANEQLYSWVLENLVKNAIDAMQGKGKINIKIHPHKNKIFVDIQDTGKGIAPNKFKDIFKPGYTTKKRGWGLGLSLAKRIIEQYHKGSIYVLESHINSGTTFRIELIKKDK